MASKRLSAASNQLSAATKRSSVATNRVIAIDGPAGSGKSSTARAVAAILGVVHLDSGSLYRAVTLVVLDGEVELDGAAIVQAVTSSGLELRAHEGYFLPRVMGKDVSGEIRSQRVTAQVSAVSALPAVREWTTAVLRATGLSDSRGAVVEGRDIGTVVFHDAALKIFLTASIEARAVRRALQEGRGEDPAYLDRLREQIAQRDETDTKRAVSPLTPASDAILLDTTDLAFDDQVAMVVEKARKLLSDG